MNSTGPGGQFASCPAFGSALQEFTISVWINTNNAPNYSNKVCVVGQVNDAVQTNSNFAIRGNGAGGGSAGYEGYIRLANTNYTVDFGAGVPSNGWTNLVFTFDDTNTMKAYVNGNQAGSTAGPAGTLLSNGFNTIIGGTDTGTSGSGADTFNGFINNVVIYNTALESGQITTLYNLYSGRFV
jgi:hypothetical protein